MDYRRQNSTTISDTYPMPSTDDCIGRLEKAKVFTALDTLWGYRQVPIKDDDRDKNTFASHLGIFRHTCMLFGL